MFGNISRTVLATLILASPASAQLNRAFVSVNGSDLNPCTSAAPCRSFGKAISVTNADGEVLAIDTGGYGPFTVDRALTVTAAPGVHAAVTAASGNAVTVSASSTDRVAVSRLSLTSQGGPYGVRILSGRSVALDSLTVEDFSTGISAYSTTPDAHTSVVDTTIRNSSGSGLSVDHPSNFQKAAIESVRILEGNIGLFVGNAAVAVANSLTSDLSSVGFWAAAGSRVVVTDSVSANNEFGFDITSGGQMAIIRCTAANNIYGIYSFGSGSTTWVSQTTIFGNSAGVTIASPAVINSRGDNTLRGNAVDGAFSGVILAH